MDAAFNMLWKALSSTCAGKKKKLYASDISAKHKPLPPNSIVLVTASCTRKLMDALLHLDGDVYEGSIVVGRTLSRCIFSDLSALMKALNTHQPLDSKPISKVRRSTYKCLHSASQLTSTFLSLSQIVQNIPGLVFMECRGGIIVTFPDDTIASISIAPRNKVYYDSDQLSSRGCITESDMGEDDDDDDNDDNEEQDDDEDDMNNGEEDDDEDDDDERVNAIGVLQSAVGTTLDPVTMAVISAFRNALIDDQCQFDLPEVAKRMVALKRGAIAQRDEARFMAHEGRRDVLHQRDYCEIIICGGDTQSGKTLFLLLDFIISYLLEVPTLLVTKFISGRSDLARKIFDFLERLRQKSVRLHDIQACLITDRQRVVAVAEACGMIIMSDTKMQLITARQTLQTAFQNTATSNYNYLIDECDAQLGSGATGANVAHEQLINFRQPVTMNFTSATHGPTYANMSVENQQMVYKDNIFRTSQPSNYVSPTAMVPFSFGGTNEFLHDKELNVKNCFTSPTAQAMHAEAATHPKAVLVQVRNTTLLSYNKLYSDHV